MSDYCKTDLYQLVLETAQAYTRRKKKPNQSVEVTENTNTSCSKTSPLNCLGSLCNS